MPVIKADDGTDLYYEVHGEGEPLLFVHGGGGNTLVWYQQVPHFARDHKVITVDLRGFKRSLCREDSIHPRYFPDDLLRIMDAEGLARVTLACQSLGAWAGLPLALSHPERVRRLFITGSPTPLYLPESWPVLLRAIGIFDEPNADKRIEGVGWNRATLAERPALFFLYGQLKSLNPPGFKAATMSDASVRIDPALLADYRVPTLHCGGAHDDFLTPDVHLAVARAIPGCLSYTFKDAGHSPYFECADEYNRVLREFMGLA